MRLRFRRFLRLLETCCNHESHIASAISPTELGVNKRTVYRDIRFLEEADIPIRYDPRKGGYVLQCHFDLRIPNVSHDELTAILLAAHIVSLSCVRTISHTLGQAINRLLAQTPLSFRESAANLLSSVRGTPSVTSWPHGSTGAIAEILSALEPETAGSHCLRSSRRGRHVSPHQSHPELHDGLRETLVLGWSLVVAPEGRTF